MIAMTLMAAAPAESATPSTAPTFNEVAPILANHCTSCHQPGAIAARSPLTSLDAVRSLAPQIRSRVASREMPPWSADPAHSVRFSNEARLQPADVDTLLAWLDAGAPAGNGPAPGILSPKPTRWAHPSGRPPDAVISMPAVTLAATGEIPYVVRKIKLPLVQDKWVQALQALPSNASVVHHMGITVVSLPRDMKPQDVEQLGALAQQMGLAADSLAPPRPAIVDPMNPDAYDMLGIYTPGSTIEVYDDASGKLLKGGDNLYINFNVHYTTTGKPETDRSQLGIWFRPDAPKHQLLRVPAPGRTIIANGRQLLVDDPGTKAEGTDFAIPPIPPYADNYELVGITGYPQPVTIYQLQPHAHMRAKDFTYTVVYPDGREETLLSVPKYDFHWQLAYQLAHPLSLPAGSKLVVTAHYDNSAANKHLLENQAVDPTGNCGPDKQAYFGQQNQSWDEMFSPMIQYSIDTVDPASEEAVARSGAKRKAPGAHPLPIVTTVGCLGERVTGQWAVRDATRAEVSSSQSTSASELAAQAALPTGRDSYPVLGIAPFGPASHKGEKVAIKGILLGTTEAHRINVTSLQGLGIRCE